MGNPSHPRVVVNVDHSAAGYAALRVAVAIAHSRRVPLQAVHARASIDTIDNDEYINQAFHEALGGFPLGLEVTKTTVSESSSGALSKNASGTEPTIMPSNSPPARRIGRVTVTTHSPFERALIGTPHRNSSPCLSR